MNRLHPCGAAKVAFLGAPLETKRGRPLVPHELLGGEGDPRLDEALLWQAWEIVRSDASLDPRGQRSLFFLVCAVLVSMRDGSTRLPLQGETLGAVLASIGMPDEEREGVDALIREMRLRPGKVVGPEEGSQPLALAGDHLYARKMLLLEARLAFHLGVRLRGVGTPAPSAAQAVAALRESPSMFAGRPVLLSDEQEEAVLRAASSPLTVISGGPGTGKTSIVVSILRVLLRLGFSPESIALAAPTGKASQRMEESILGSLASLASPAEEDRELIDSFPRPTTLHRLLGYSPGADRFRHHEGNPLDQRVVIVDEASMVDIGLMDRLLRSLAADVRLVLLGDADQLPSVEAGAVFRDLVPSDGEEGEDPRDPAAVRLRRSFRMDPRDPSGRSILGLAKAVHRGDVAALWGGEGIVRRATADEIRSEKVELLSQGEREAFLRGWYRRGVCEVEDAERLVRMEWRWDGERFEDEEGLRSLFAAHERSRILCVTRVEEGAGADSINAFLQGIHVEAHGLDPDHRFPPGMPVMITRNDYERDLFNGDQGLVLRVRARGERGHRFRVIFPRGGLFSVHPLDVLARGLEPAWAMTVHKSQGSEFDAVALVLPREDMPLLTREILYTGLTRSRRSVVLVGEREVLEQGVRRRLVRHSGIVERLAGPAGSA